MVNISSMRKIKKNRFRIETGISGVLARFDTLEECVKWGENNEPLSECEYVIDVQEEMEVPLEDVIKAFESGERPLDLYHF